MHIFLTLFALMLLPFVAIAQDTFDVHTSQIQDRKAVLATVQTVDLTSARARIGGTLSTLMVDEGSIVKAGEVIAQVVDEKLFLEMQAVEAREASLQAERQLAQIALDRAVKLRKSGAGSQAKLDEARTNLDVVVRNLRAMQSEKKLVLEREREGAVVSPANGRVLSVKVAKGAVILPGETIATIAQEEYILRIEVPERHARFIKVGDMVDVDERTASGAMQQKGTIVQVYPQMQQGRVVADVSVDGIGDFFIGERIRVYVGTGQRKGIVIPEQFIYARFGLDYVRLSDGTELVVQPGQRLPEGIEILSGLRNGDVLKAGM